MDLRQRAFNLVELMVTLSLLGILLSFSLPAASSWIRANQDESVREQLLAILSESRAHAVTSGVPVELCGASDPVACNGDWRNNWRVSQAGPGVTRIHQVAHAEGLNWRGFKPVIQFMPNGTSPLGNGRFVLCRGEKSVWELVINRQGRVRHVAKNQLGESCMTSRPAS